MRVLIIDDSKIFRGMLRRLLREAGVHKAEVFEASGGEEGLRMIVSERPDLVIADVNMPDLNGVVLLRLARAQGSEVKFGFVTSENTDRVRKLAREHGAKFIIRKPVSADELRQTLINIGSIAA